MFDIIIKNGLVADGTGAEPKVADVAIEGGFIAAIAPSLPGEAKRVINAEGLMVTPGFIDMHSHADFSALLNPNGSNKLVQGITTEVGGHCGDSVSPSYPGSLDSYYKYYPKEKVNKVYAACLDFSSFKEAMENAPMSTNMALVAGHGSIRAAVMGDDTDAAPSKTELEQMKLLTAKAMEAGFLGMSTGLVYPPSVYGNTEELIELAKVVSTYRGCYASHIRGESDTLIEAVEEAIRIGEESGCDVIVSHHKVCGKQNEGKSAATCRLIEEANARGRVRVFADQYPFIACNTSLIAAVPPRYAAVGRRALIENLKNPAMRKEIAAAITRGEDAGRFLSDSGFAGALVLESPYTPECVGKYLSDIAAARGAAPFDTMFDLIVENQGNVQMAYFNLVESDMDNIISKPYVMAGTDSGHDPVTDPEAVGGAHPRAMATFTKHLRLVRERGLFSPAMAIRRLTGQPADAYRVRGIGYLKEGYRADVCIIDYNNVGETNDFVHPYRPNTGIEYVIVNGEVSVENGKYNGATAGRYVTR